MMATVVQLCEWTKGLNFVAYKLYSSKASDWKVNAFV